MDIISPVFLLPFTLGGWDGYIFTIWQYWEYSIIKFSLFDCKFFISSSLTKYLCPNKINTWSINTLRVWAKVIIIVFNQLDAGIWIPLMCCMPLFCLCVSIFWPSLISPHNKNTFRPRNVIVFQCKMLFGF